MHLEGVEKISNQEVKGRYEILAICDNAAILIDRDGTKQLVSRTEPLQIYPERVSIEIGEAVQITTQEIDQNAVAIKCANQNGFTVNLSADSIEEADELVSLETGPVATVLPEETRKSFH